MVVNIFARAVEAMVSAAVLLQCDATTEEAWDKQSYWYGFYAGSTIAVCQLFESGLLSKSDAKDYLVGLYEVDDDIPKISSASALNYVKSDKTFKRCPLP
jgi:hypothetical protein